MALSCLIFKKNEHILYPSEAVISMTGPSAAETREREAEIYSTVQTLMTADGKQVRTVKEENVANMR